MRHVGAVLAGFLAVVLLSTGTDAVLHATGVFPPVPVRMSDGLFLVAVGYRTVYTVFGGFITARLAPTHPWLNGGALAILGTLGGAVGVGVALGSPELGPLWYAAALLLEAIPCVFLGTWLGSIRQQPYSH